METNIKVERSEDWSIFKKIDGNKHLQETVWLPNSVYRYSIGHLTEQEVIEKRNKFITALGYNVSDVVENIPDKYRNVGYKSIETIMEGIRKSLKELEELINNKPTKI